MHSTPSLFAVLGLSLTLSACSGAPTTSTSRENSNPLTASRYGDELADTMAGLIIQNDASAKDPTMRKAIDAAILQGKKLGTEARLKQEEGMKGPIIAMKVETDGYALYVDDTLYLSSEFVTVPGVDLRAFLTTIADPRDGAFPDKTAIDLGVIQSAYGAQQYNVPHQDNPMLYRTFVLFDKKLKRVYGFAQLSK